MRKFVAFAFFATASLSAMTIAPASAHVGNAGASGATEVASPVSSASATILAFNPQPDPPGRAEEDFGFDPT